VPAAAAAAAAATDRQTDGQTDRQTDRQTDGCTVVASDPSGGECHVISCPWDVTLLMVVTLCDRHPHQRSNQQEHRPRHNDAAATVAASASISRSW
jgi:hypothetical protein